MMVSNSMKLTATQGSITGSLGTASWINQGKAGLNKVIVSCSERGEVSVSFILILARFWYRLYRVCTVKLKGDGLEGWAETCLQCEQRTQRVWTGGVKSQPTSGTSQSSDGAGTAGHLLQSPARWTQWLCHTVHGISWVSSQPGEQGAIHRDLKPCKLRNGPPGPAGSSPSQVYSAWRTKHQWEIIFCFQLSAVNCEEDRGRLFLKEGQEPTDPNFNNRCSSCMSRKRDFTLDW